VLDVFHMVHVESGGRLNVSLVGSDLTLGSIDVIARGLKSISSGMRVSLELRAHGNLLGVIEQQSRRCIVRQGYECWTLGTRFREETR
jgi:hypothetical protein